MAQITHDPNLCIDWLRKGGLCALPTETVYGLAARYDHPNSINSIFQIKGRPANDPLIIHVSTKKDIQDFVENITPLAKKLIDSFWPGPLTLVFPKSSLVSQRISGGLTTVAIRCPDHKITQNIIEKLGTAIVAPSANPFSKTSPTTAQHVAEGFPNDNIFILDAGPCRLGIESTVVDTVSGRILRPGHISVETLAPFLKDYKGLTPEERQKSPGFFKKHYAPAIPLILFSKSWDGNWQPYLQKLSPKETKPGLPLRVSLDSDGLETAKRLYSQLHSLPKKKPSYLYIIENGQREGVWEAIWERLEKAASFDFR